jgi:hypothetical protein
MNTDNKMSIEDIKGFCYFLPKSKWEWTPKKEEKKRWIASFLAMTGTKIL